MPLPSSGTEANHARPPTSAPCLSPAPTTTAGAVPGQDLSGSMLVYPPHSATNPVPPASRGSAAVVTVAAPAGMPAGFVWVAALADAPGNTATSYAPRAAPPTAPPAAPPPLFADLAQMFDRPIDLDGALAALPAPSAAPAASSSSWLEQQELAELLDDQLTGPEAVEVSNIQ